MTSELGKRIAFTIGALLVYRLGTYIPLPGIDPSVWAQIFRAQAGTVLGPFNLVSGGGIHRLAIFGLDILPYISAALIVQLISIVSQKLGALKEQGERGRQTINRRTRYLAVLIAAIQAYGVAGALESVCGLVANPGWFFILSTVVTLTGGTMVLVWLSEQITLRGIGNGIALLLLAGIMTQLPEAIARTLELERRGLLSSRFIVGSLAIMIVATGFVVLMERARRLLPIDYAERQIGMRMIEARSSNLSLKLIAAGIVPIILASWLLIVVSAFAYIAAGRSPGWLITLASGLERGRPPYLVVYTVLIILCALAYAAVVLDPEKAAENLTKHRGSIPGVAPGEAAAEHLDHVLSRTTVIGAVYLVLVCLIPEILISYAEMPFYFGGAALLIVVCTILDIDAQVKVTRIE
jgi:preprotein translocase subunit SecY